MRYRGLLALLLILVGAGVMLAGVFLDLAIFGSPSYITEPRAAVAWAEFGLYVAVVVIAIITITRLIRSNRAGGSCYLCGRKLGDK